jgi:hypothetical protein
LKVEQSRVEQSRAEQSRAEQNREKPARPHEISQAREETRDLRIDSESSRELIRARKIRGQQSELGRDGESLPERNKVYENTQ